MSAILKAALFTLCFAVCSHAQTRTVAVYADVPFNIQQEVQRLVQPAGVDLVWKDIHQRNAADSFEMITVGSIDGPCSVANLPADDAETFGALADTSVSNGRVLPFFRIDCAHVLRFLTPLLRSRVIPDREAILGRALARVIAHELYHILARTAVHHDFGIAKSSFSIDDLIKDQFAFDSSTIAEMRPVVAASLVSSEETTR